MYYIWITTTKLEEANGNTSMPGKIIERSIRAQTCVNYELVVSKSVVQPNLSIHSHGIVVFYKDRMHYFLKLLS